MQWEQHMGGQAEFSIHEVFSISKRMYVGFCHLFGPALKFLVVWALLRKQYEARSKWDERGYFLICQDYSGYNVIEFETSSPLEHSRFGVRKTQGSVEKHSIILNIHSVFTRKDVVFQTSTV